MVANPAKDVLDMVRDGWVVTSCEVSDAGMYLHFYLKHSSGDRARIRVPGHVWLASPSLWEYELGAGRP